MKRYSFVCLVMFSIISSCGFAQEDRGASIRKDLEEAMGLLNQIQRIEDKKQQFGNGLYWELNNGVLTISGNGAMPDVNDINKPWGKDVAIKKVVIQYGITAIGNDFFNETYNINHTLQSVEIPSSVKTVGDNAFCNCKKLSAVSIPYSVTSIGEGAFFGCESLTSITIPNSVTIIKDH